MYYKGHYSLGLPMDYQKLCKDMKSLWSFVFHDSTEYIDMLFSACFNPSLAAWRYEKGRLTSALLGIPYEFRSAGGTLRGLYLCGLATHPDFRGQGVMTELMEEINIRAKKMGYAFTFLIPANNGLLRYYEDRGYSPAFRTVTERYTASHSFYRDYVGWVNRNEPLIRNERLKYFEAMNCVALNHCESSNVKNPSSEDRYDNAVESRVCDIFLSGIEGNVQLSSKEIEKFLSLPGDIDRGIENCNVEVSEILHDNIGESKRISEQKYANVSDKKVVFLEEEIIQEVVSEDLNSVKSFNDSNVGENIHNPYNDNGDTALKNNQSRNSEIDNYDVYRFMNSCEVSEPELSLVHTYKDYRLIIKDCIDSGDDVLVVVSSGKISALGFIFPESDKIKVKHLYSKDRGSELRLLHEVTVRWPNMPVEVVVYPEEIKRKALEDRYFVGAVKGTPIVPDVKKVDHVVSSESLSEIYGMARILDFSDFMEFVATNRSDANFSILMKEDGAGKIIRFEGKGGNLRTTLLNENDLRRRMESPDCPIPIVFSENQLQTLLLRKSVGEKDTVTLAFGLPAVRMNMTLLLD